jgi:hypothetical protein
MIDVPNHVRSIEGESDLVSRVSIEITNNSDDNSARIELLKKLRRMLTPEELEELDEAVLKEISNLTQIPYHQVILAYTQIITLEKGAEKAEDFFRTIYFINSQKLQYLVANFNRMQSEKPDSTSKALLHNIDMAQAQNYWREGELQRTYEYALLRGLVTMVES